MKLPGNSDLDLILLFISFISIQVSLKFLLVSLNVADKIQKIFTLAKAIEQYFPVVHFIMFYKVSFGEIQWRDHFKQYFPWFYLFFHVQTIYYEDISSRYRLFCCRRNHSW